MVTSFTMDSGSELYEELGKADGRLLEQDDDSDDEDSGKSSSGLSASSAR